MSPNQTDVSLGFSFSLLIFKTQISNNLLINNKMDTTHIAYIAEDLISHRLQRSGLIVAKPKFDRDGADLLAFMTVDNGAKFCRIQCKGRSLIKSNASVDVYENYVTDGFILFLFVDDGTEGSSNLFCFLPIDIRGKWELKTYKGSKRNLYRLSISKCNFSNVNKKGNLIEYYFSEQKIEEIKNTIRQSDVKEEFKQFFDVIKKQRDLIKLQKEKNELEDLLKDLKNTEELKNAMEERIKNMEEYYNYTKEQMKKGKKSKN